MATKQVEEAQAAEYEMIGLEQVSNRAFRNGHQFFVASATKRGKFYMVVDGVCTCPGFQFNHTCNHLVHLEREGIVEPDDDLHGYGHRATAAAKAPYVPKARWRRVPRSQDERTHK